MGEFMEHTIEAYLDRQPTEKLVQFLQDYGQGKIAESYDETLPYMIAVLKKRKQQEESTAACPPVAQKST